MLIKSITSSSIGNILEWYDFGLFAIYSALFSQLFFPTDKPEVALIATLTIFAVGFLCRPIGAILFGVMGDTQGRVKTLRLSILMISLPTLLIGFLPTYATAGILAPILLMIIRIWQGISLGGEYSGNIIYLAESAPNKYRATVTSLAGSGANLGILLASVIGAISHWLFTDAQFNAWAWRIPYLFSGILSLLIYFTRLHMRETKVFKYLKENKLLAQHPLKITLTENIFYVLRTIGLICMGTTFYYFAFIFIPLFFFEKQFTFMQTSTLMIYLMIAMTLLVPVAGRICDAVGRKKMCLFNSLFVMIIVIPSFYLLESHYLPAVIAVLIIFVIASSLEQGTTSITVVENYPATARYTGLSLGYNLGNGILGGTAPVICEYLIKKTHGGLTPAIYICLCAAITLIVVIFFVKETKGIDLH
jgi:MHS family proline/betaine transporter-like MFS transporter